MEFKKGDVTFTVPVLGALAGAAIVTTMVSEICKVLSIKKK